MFTFFAVGGSYCSGLFKYVFSWNKLKKNQLQNEQKTPNFNNHNIQYITNQNGGNRTKPNNISDSGARCR